MLWFGFGAHEVLQNGTTKEQGAYFDDLGAILRESGAVKSEVSTKRKQAKQIGAKFAALFGAELQTDYVSEADFVQACFVAAQASGATSMPRLVDWAVNGDPDATDKAKDKAAQEKAETAAAARAESIAAIDAAPVAQMGFDDEPAIVPAPVQELNQQGETGSNSLDQVCAAMRRLNDAQLDELARTVIAEITSRATAAASKAA